MKKEYKIPQTGIVEMEQPLLNAMSKTNEETSGKPSYSPRLGRNQNGFDEDEEDEEEDW